MVTHEGSSLNRLSESLKHKAYVPSINCSTVRFLLIGIREFLLRSALSSSAPVPLVITGSLLLKKRILVEVFSIVNFLAGTSTWSIYPIRDFSSCVFAKRLHFTSYMFSFAAAGIRQKKLFVAYDLIYLIHPSRHLLVPSSRFLRCQFWGLVFLLHRSSHLEFVKLND